MSTTRPPTMRRPGALPRARRSRRRSRQPDVVLRPVGPDDAALISDLFNSLSSLSRLQRFLSPMPRFSRVQVSFLATPSGPDHIAWLAVADGRCVGIARAVRLAPDADTAEVAFTVAEGWRGRGLGAQLLQAVLDAAARYGIVRTVAVVMPTNDAAKALLRGAGMRLRLVEGLIEGELPLRVLGPVAW